MKNKVKAGDHVRFLYPDSSNPIESKMRNGRVDKVTESYLTLGILSRLATVTGQVTESLEYRSFLFNKIRGPGSVITTSL